MMMDRAINQNLVGLVSLTLGTGANLVTDIPRLQVGEIGRGLL